MIELNLTRNMAGSLVLHLAGIDYENVVPVRAFPLSSPDELISLTDSAGHELVWIEKLSDIPSIARSLIEAELNVRWLTLVIQKIQQVSSFATPSTWQVETDRGTTELLLKAEDHIRRLSPNSLLITDGHGLSFLIPAIEQLDHHSRRLLDRFL